MIVSGRGYRGGLSGLGLIQEFGDIAYVVTSILTGSANRQRRQAYEGAMRALLKVPSSPFEPQTNAWPTTDHQAAPIHWRFEPSAYQKAALASYQKALYPWFLNVLKGAVQFTESQQQYVVSGAENYMRQYLVDPADVYLAIAKQLGVNPADISKSVLASGLSTGDQTNAQAATAQIEQKAAQIATQANVLNTAPIVAPSTSSSAPSPSPAASPIQTIAPAPIIIPPAPSNVFIAPASPGAEIATSAPATSQTVAPAAATVFDWNKWAMPLAVVAAALLPSLMRSDDGSNGSSN